MNMLASQSVNQCYDLNLLFANTNLSTWENRKPYTVDHSPVQHLKGDDCLSVLYTLCSRFDFKRMKTVILPLSL